MKENEDNRCFVIMPFSGTDAYEKEHFDKVYDQIFKPAIEKAGYGPYRVDENKICDSIIDKIFDAVQNCPMALCDLSTKNPNVLYELGLRQAYDRPVVLVQDDKTDRIFDVSGINTVQYNSHRLVENVEKAIGDIAEALIQTKEGKGTTLAKIVRAKGAEFSQVNMDEEENIGIILKSILSDIQELKRENSKDILPRTIPMRDKVYSKHTMTFVVNKKKDLTRLGFDHYMELFMAGVFRGRLEVREFGQQIIFGIEGYFDDAGIKKMRDRIAENIGDIVETSFY